MRRIAIGLGVVLALALLWFASEQLAAESGEVVVLRTFDAAGAPHETRLWIVDDAGASWLRAGDPHSSWLLRLEAKPEVEVVRGGGTLAFRATPAPEAQARINALMDDKYGWANRYIGAFFPRSRATPVRLDPR
jgi:hypothetical protein